MGKHRDWQLLLPFQHWPEIDRLAWETAFFDGDVLDGSGPAAHWATATRRTNRQHYGCWLGYLRHHNLLSNEAPPAARVVLENVRDYVSHLQESVAPRSVVSALVGLKVVMKAITPQQNWRWLADVCNALNRSARPQKDKASRMRATGDIYAACIRELNRLLTTPLTQRIERVAYRDALMLAMLTARPLRLGNFTHLHLGKDIFRQGLLWMLLIPGAEVKNGQTLEYALPAGLNAYLDIYLTRIRPSFMDTTGTAALWLTFDGKPLSYYAIYGRIMMVSMRLLGVAINPHLLRDCAATSLSTVSPAAARAAAPLLGHRQFATTERHYIRANQLEANRTVNTVLSAIKASSK
jgi:site-specific recombinase XerD